MATAHTQKATQAQAILQNAKEFIHILTSCKTDQLEKWKVTDLKRAIHWAIHFEIVHKKMSKLKESVREKFNAKFIKLGDDAGVLPSGQKFDIDFFSRGMQYLVKSILDNPCLTAELRESLINNEEVTKRNILAVDGVQNTQNCSLEDTSKDLKLFQKLTEIQISFMGHHPGLCLLPVEGDTIADCIVLLEQLRNKGIANYMEIIDTSHSQSQHGIKVVLSCLLLAQYNQYDDVKTRLLNWFDENLRNHLVIQPMDTQYYRILANVSSQLDEFFQLYLRDLLTLTDQYNAQYVLLTEGVANQSPPPHYNELLLPWKYLAQTPLKEKTVSVVKGRAQRFKECRLVRNNCLWLNIIDNIDK